MLRSAVVVCYYTGVSNSVLCSQPKLASTMSAEGSFRLQQHATLSSLIESRRGYRLKDDLLLGPAQGLTDVLAYRFN